MRDEQARIPLFVKESGSGVTGVGTSLRRLGSGAELQPQYFCRCLNGNMAQPHARPTPFAGVHRVLGGEVIELTITGQIQGRSLRSPAGAYDPPVPGHQTRHTAAQLLREALECAVDRRLGRMTAFHVSGGTDSSSLALLAAQRMTVNQTEPQDLVLLAGRFGHGELAQEQPYIDEAITAILHRVPTARPVIVDADDIADFDDFHHHAGEPDEPYSHAFRAPFWARLHSTAAGLGCDTLVTGCGADPIADANSLHLHMLARGGQLRRMMQEAHTWAAGNERGLREILLNNVVQPSLPLTVDRVRALTKRQATVLGGLGSFGRPRWLRTRFARKYGYRAASFAESRFVFGRKPEDSRYEAANYISAPDPLSWFRAPADGFFMSHPFLDPEVVATMRRLPAQATFQPGRPKAVLREAMADLLPPLIRERTVKVPFDGLYAQGLRKHGDELVELCRSARHPLIPEMFDIETLCRAVKEAELGLGDAVAWDRMNTSLALVAWLEHLNGPVTDAGSATRSVSVPLPGRCGDGITGA
jgi:asparagine synthase (glutamine-hydrolysing)